MTDEVTVPEPDDATQPQTPDASPDEPGPERGEARLRRRAQAAEAERDALTARVDRLRRREVERLAGEHLAAAADLFDIGGVQLSDVLDDAGDVSVSLVQERIDALLESRPGLAKVLPAKWQDMGQGRRTPTKTQTSSWATALRG